MPLLPDRNQEDWLELLDRLESDTGFFLESEVSAYLRAVLRRDHGYLVTPNASTTSKSDREIWFALGFTAGANTGIFAMKAMRDYARTQLRRHGERITRERRDREARRETG